MAEKIVSTWSKIEQIKFIKNLISEIRLAEAKYIVEMCMDVGKDVEDLTLYMTILRQVISKVISGEWEFLNNGFVEKIVRITSEDVLRLVE